MLALRALATAWVAVNGFVAISDDDYARTVIAQQFSFEPKWDPSGSSWLPFPFWLTGLLMRGLGPHIAVAQAAACALSLLSAASVYLAARWLELPKLAALLGACGAALLPHAVWLGYATVPDGYSAALALLALASTTRREIGIRALGATLISAAALCRYELWSLSLFVAALTLWDAWQRRRWALLALAALAVAGPVGWMLHGSVSYGDPVFFVSRVASYRQMIGESATSLGQVLAGYPLALVRAEPELTLTLLSALPLLWQRKLPSSLLRPALGALALFSFLVWGDLRDGAPTHHPERPLLCIWLVACLIAGYAVSHWITIRARGWLAALPVVIAFSAVRSWYTHRDSFAERHAELALGRRAHELAAGERLLIDSGDYGYFAVVAAFEDPSRAFGVVDGDPRQPKLEVSGPRERLRHYLARERSTWVVLQRDQMAELGAVGAVRAEAGRLVLVQVDPSYVIGH